MPTGSNGKISNYLIKVNSKPEIFNFVDSSAKANQSLIIIYSKTRYSFKSYFKFVK